MKLILSFLISVTILTISCKEDDCLGSHLSEDIIGTWKAINETGGIKYTGTVEFKKDSTFVNEPADLLIQNINIPSNPIYSYRIEQENLVVIINSDNQPEFGLIYKLIETKCDSFILKAFGGVGPLTLIKQ